MTAALARGIDLIFDLIGCLGAGLLVYTLAGRFIAPDAGTVLGLGVAISALGFSISDRLQQDRLELLARGECPRCHRPLRTEHQHRRWDGARNGWLPALTSAHCSCGFSLSQSKSCPACPTDP
jgi:hypothetical protein